MTRRVVARVSVVVDAIFAHPRLASIYDAFDGDRDDLVLYVNPVRELEARRVLDVGCGTVSTAIWRSRPDGLSGEPGRTGPSRRAR